MLSRSANAVSPGNRKFSLLLCHLALSLEVTLSNLSKSFTDPETRVLQAADGEDLVILACTVLRVLAMIILSVCPTVCLL